MLLEEDDAPISNWLLTARSRFVFQTKAQSTNPQTLPQTLTKFDAVITATLKFDMMSFVTLASFPVLLI
eukprot:472082-Pyramimonas_sp.AAC.1